jgi:hypothetical protein
MARVIRRLCVIGAFIPMLVRIYVCCCVEVLRLFEIRQESIVTPSRITNDTTPSIVIVCIATYPTDLTLQVSYSSLVF